MVNKETVERMAYLARLPVTADETLCKELSDIMEYMDTVESIAPAETPPALHSVLREDEPGGCISPESLEGVAFIVPKAVE